MVEVPRERPVLVIDGDGFDDLAGFTRAFSRLLDHHEWRGHPDALNDILRGGFGTPEGGWTLRWLNSERSREVLGDATFELYVRIIRIHGPGGWEEEDDIVLELR